MRFSLNKFLKWPKGQLLRYAIAILATLAVLMFGTLLLFVWFGWRKLVAALAG